MIPVAPAVWPSLLPCWKRLRMVNGISGKVLEVMGGYRSAHVKYGNYKIIFNQKCDLF